MLSTVLLVLLVLLVGWFVAASLLALGVGCAVRIADARRAREEPARPCTPEFRPGA